MLSIKYHDAVAPSGFDANFHIDRSGDKYILRACDFTLAGKNYSLSEQIEFSAPDTTTENFSGWLVAKGNFVRLIVLDKAIIGRLDYDQAKKFKSQFGEIIWNLFTTVSYHHGADEISILVSRLIPPGADLADNENSNRTAPTGQAIGESDSDLFKSVRSQIESEAAPVSSDKVWDQLDEAGKTAVMRKIAETMGFVAKK